MVVQRHWTPSKSFDATLTASLAKSVLNPRVPAAVPRVVRVVLMPVVLKAGIDPVYFGVMFIMNNAIGLITPPVGTVLNVVCGVAKISMDDAFKGVLPFLLAQLAVLFLLVLFPSIVLVPLHWLMR